MTATERLRDLLNERGAEWEALPDQQEGEFTITATRWHDGEGGLLTMFLSEPHGSTWDFFWLPTPEQAIVATLGGEDTYTREDVEGAFVSGYSLGLDAFDSSKPDSEKGWNQNERNLDEEMDDLGWVRKDAATLGAGTCHVKAAKKIGDLFGFSLSCGHSMVSPFNDHPDYCPWCGRKVVDE